MEILKDLYYKYYLNSDEYQELDAMPEVKEAGKKLEEWTKYFDKEDYLELEFIVTGITNAHEMQGWSYGYMFAMQLVNACGVKVGATA